MEKSIASHPDAAKFRSIASIILILIFIGAFLGYTQSLTRQADRVARDRALSEIRQALAMMLYDYAIKGKLADLQKFDSENPFSLMAAYRPLPAEYKGAKATLKPGLEAGWYFDLKTRRVIWVALDGSRQKYQLHFEYEDVNRNNHFDPATDQIIGLDITKAS